MPDFEARKLTDKMGKLEVTEEMVLKKIKKLKPNKSPMTAVPLIIIIIILVYLGRPELILCRGCGLAA